MRIACFVPIKMNSQRLPRKMLLPLGSKLLFQHIFDRLLEVKSNYESNDSHTLEIYCYCSDETISQYLPENVIFLKRDPRLDRDETLGIDIYRSFIEVVDADIYALCHATSPFIKSASIIQGLDCVLSGIRDSAMSVSKIQTFCWYKNAPLNYDLNNVVRTQDIESVYYETSAFYIFKKDLLLKNGRRVSDNPLLVETDRIESIDIDEKADYDLAKNIAD